MASRLRTFNLYDKQSPRSKRMAEKIPNRETAAEPATHPLVRIHPETKTGPLYQRHADHDAFRRHDTRREPTVDPALPQTCDATGVHLPYPLVAGDARHLGHRCLCTWHSTITPIIAVCTASRSRAMRRSAFMIWKRRMTRSHSLIRCDGAEIRGANLRDIDDETFADIHKILLDHGMIFFRDQDITLTQQLIFAKRWGEPHFHPYMPGLPDHPGDHRDREKPGGYAHIRRPMAYRSDVHADARDGNDVVCEGSPSSRRRYALWKSLPRIRRTVGR